MRRVLPLAGDGPKRPLHRIRLIPGHGQVTGPLHRIGSNQTAQREPQGRTPLTPATTLWSESNNGGDGTARRLRQTCPPRRGLARLVLPDLFVRPSVARYECQAVLPGQPLLPRQSCANHLRKSGQWVAQLTGTQSTSSTSGVETNRTSLIKSSRELQAKDHQEQSHSPDQHRGAHTPV